MNVKRGLTTLGGLALAATAGLSARFYLGRQRADQAWATSRYPRLEDLGTVERLSILPLIDWYTARDDLVSEAGVSYLVRADDTSILFDLGYNGQREHPSPLLRNMEALGVELAELDALVISHAHLDHIGGMVHQRRRTFGLSTQPVDLRGITAYVPVPLSNPTAQVTVVNGPQLIAPGVATMGTIPRQLFFFGWTPEQSLAVNVAGKGIVLIVGCGHPTLQRIVERAEMLFDAPIYGLVGGLHYPVTASRGDRFGVPLQRIFGTGKWPWDPINRDDVQSAIAYLQRRAPQLVSLSSHDSCDWSIDALRSAFGEAYQDLLVGQEIVVE
jgi:7,8-dihydropterin-6-yl-methyl-4-(beta-D-ribofuranosyl)aminobenzene 5'-phosphate synthase